MALRNPLADGPFVRNVGANIELELGAETILLNPGEARDLCHVIQQRITRAQFVADQVLAVGGWLQDVKR